MSISYCQHFMRIQQLDPPYHLCIHLEMYLVTHVPVILW